MEQDWLVHAAQPVANQINDLLTTTHIVAGHSVFIIDTGKHPLNDYVKPLSQHIDSRTAPSKIIILVATRKRLLELRESFKNQLSKDCDLLITTTGQLSLLNLEQLLPEARIDCLVLDELQKLQAYGGSSFQALKSEILKFCNSTQMVVTNRLWQAEEIKDLLQHAKQPLLVFKDPLEAAAYGGVLLEIALADNIEQQLQQLLDYLKRNPPECQRTLIFAARSENLELIQQKLPKDACLLHRGRKDKARIEQWQRQHTGKVLLLQTHAPELHVDNVQNLIHFNMPLTWNQFRKRFAVFHSRVPNALMPDVPMQQLQSLVLLNMESQRTLPQLIEFMQQHGHPIDKQLTVAHAQLLATREAALAARQCVLCPVLLLYGHCKTSSTCQYRHVLKDNDRNRGTVPRAGAIRFQLLKICTPAHFAARLVAHRTSNVSPWVSLSITQRYEQLQQQLKSYYATPENCVVPTLTELQQICVRKLAANCYERVCVTFVSPMASVDARQCPNLTVRVKHMDLDTVIHHAKLSELFVCHQELQQIEALALDVRLAGIVPYDGEEVWQNTETATAAELLQPGAIYEATVDFCLSQTIFASNLKLESVEYHELLQQQLLGKFVDHVKNRLENLVKAVDT